MIQRVILTFMKCLSDNQYKLFYMKVLYNKICLSTSSDRHRDMILLRLLTVLSSFYTKNLPPALSKRLGYRPTLLIYLFNTAPRQKYLAMFNFYHAVVPPPPPIHPSVLVCCYIIFVTIMAREH